MYLELEEYLNLNIEENSPEIRLSLIENKLNEKILHETDIFKFFSLIGMLSIVKINKVNPNLLMIPFQDLYKNLMNYLINGELCNEFINQMNIIYKDNFIFRFANLITRDEIKKLLFALACILSNNDNLTNIYHSILFSNKLSKKIILIYDESFQNSKDSSQLFNDFFNEIYIKLGYYVNEENILVVSYINKKFKSSIIDNKSEKAIELSKLNNNKINFNILLYYINNKREEKKIFNVKNLKNSINFLEMDEVRKEINKVRLENSQILSKYDEQIKILEKRIEELENEKTKYFLLKDRFIYKCFSDYLFVIFGINLNDKLVNKRNRLIEKAKVSKINSPELLEIIEELRNVYFEQSSNAHFIPKKHVIRSAILITFEEYFNSNLCPKIEKLFNKLSPEEDIIFLMEKNDEIIKLLYSEEDIKEKESKKKKIIGEINDYFDINKREKILKEIKNIFPA